MVYLEGNAKDSMAWNGSRQKEIRAGLSRCHGRMFFLFLFLSQLSVPASGKNASGGCAVLDVASLIEGQVGVMIYEQGKA